MTVQELIRSLQQYHPDLPVVIEVPTGEDGFEWYGFDQTWIHSTDECAEDIPRSTVAIQMNPNPQFTYEV
jgi:hypothetical protein